MIWYKNFNWKEITNTEDDPLPRYLENINNLMVVYKGILKSRLDNYPTVLYLYIWGQPPPESAQYQRHNEINGCNCDNCTQYNEAVLLTHLELEHRYGNIRWVENLNFVLSFPTIVNSDSPLFLDDLKLINFMETFPHPNDGRLRNQSRNDHPYIAHAPLRGHPHPHIRNLNPNLIKAVKWINQFKRSINYPGGI